MANVAIKLKDVNLLKRSLHHKEYNDVEFFNALVSTNFMRYDYRAKLVESLLKSDAYDTIRCNINPIDMMERYYICFGVPIDSTTVSTTTLEYYEFIDTIDSTVYRDS
ncbi:hypothetical protein HDU86_007576 [Geranomyces michiganensis]|nr:hypothetical protein HDU86_007576 [Geranomyces michiganensis]